MEAATTVAAAAADDDVVVVVSVVVGVVIFVRVNIIVLITSQEPSGHSMHPPCLIQIRLFEHQNADSAFRAALKIFPLNILNWRPS